MLVCFRWRAQKTFNVGFDVCVIADGVRVCIVVVQPGTIIRHGRVVSPLLFVTVINGVMREVISDRPCP